MDYFYIGLTVVLIGLAIIATVDWHGHLSLDSSYGVQKIHTEATPRIGGVAIVAGLGMAWWLSGSETARILAPMLLAGSIAFGFGLVEDITKRIGVRARLLATLASGVIVCLMTDTAMQNTGVPPLDWALEFMPLAIAFTAFAIGGVANATNIIDGFNGLATGAISLMFVTIGALATSLNDAAFANVCFALAACSLGFFAINWPLGKIFLGDGGAYLLGFCLAWMAVLLPMRHDEVNAWTTLLICSGPVLEVMFSVLRRRAREGHHPGQPDKLHMHHMVHRRIVCQLWPNLSAPIKNGLTGLLCLVPVALTCAWAIVFATHTLALVAGTVLFALLYSLVYFRLTQFRWFASTESRQLKLANRH